jgi:hypothetical protein
VQFPADLPRTGITSSHSQLLLWIVCVGEQSTTRRRVEQLKGASYRIDQHFKTLFNLLQCCRDTAFRRKKIVEGFAFAQSKVIRFGYRGKGFYFGGNASALEDASGKRYLFISHSAIRLSIAVARTEECRCLLDA